MSIENIIITSENLSNILKDFKANSSRRKIVFVIGSGCSVEGGIKTGEHLAKEWYAELEKFFSKKALEEWKQKIKLDEKDLGYHYTQIFKKRFEHDKKSGFEFLTRLMEKGEPSAGHILLARALTNNDHRTVITTNFDHLVEQSIYSFTNRIPFICGHEKLAEYATNSLDNPLVVKIHRDIHFDPDNEPETTDTLDNEWADLLEQVFYNSIVIVIGYGGNDGSLMGYLENNTKISKLYWTLYNNDEPRKEIVDLVKKKDGRFVRHNGFSLLMIHIANGLKINFGGDDLEKEQNEKLTKYKKRFIELSEQVKEKGNTDDKEAVQSMVKNSKRTWWSAQLEINAENDTDKQDKLYQKALIEFPESHELMGNYAIFLKNIKKNYDEAEKYYLKALKLAPDAADYNGNYALFLKNIKKNYDEAEKYYLKALKLAPDSADYNGNYALFLNEVKKNYDDAEIYHQKALELRPNDANINCNYAVFLDDIRKNYNDAEKYYVKALELEPNNALFNSNYATFLISIRKKYVEAEIYHQKALELEPNNADVNGNYAAMLFGLGRKEQALKYYNKAIASENLSDNLMLELYFYQYAHLENKEEAEEKITSLLAQGKKSEGWDFSLNIERAIKDKHPNPKRLKELATMISGLDY